MMDYRKHKRGSSVKYILFISSVILGLCWSAIAKDKEIQKENYPKKIGEFGDWRAFVSQKNGKKICYMVSFPTKQKGRYKKRGKPYFMVTHRPKDKSYNVVSVHAGYRFLKDSKPTIIIAAGETEKEFELFVEGESAWAPSDDVDQALTKMMTKTGESLTVKGESFKGSKITDTYSLKGSLSAYKVISQECGLTP